LRQAPARRRIPEVTRERLLQAAFEEFYHWGFQSADLDAVLARAGLTKGALYHHFASKEALGHAVIEEVIAPGTREHWLVPLARAVDPIETLIGIIESISVELPAIAGGCPLNNLSQEMSSLDEGFRQRLAAVFEAWGSGIAAALERGQRRGSVRRDLDPKDTAAFLIATYEGYLSLAKNSRDGRILQSGKKRLGQFLETLRPVNRGPRRPMIS
jgi:TetR/AcrR family transcriptional repressor of nem operon